jgi:diguanylate cyclase (GGDEF)-like protein
MSDNQPLNDAAPLLTAKGRFPAWRGWLKKLGLFRSLTLLTALSVSMSVAIVSVVEMFMFGRIRPLVLFEASVTPMLIAPPIIFTLLHLTFKLDEAEREFHLLATTDPLTKIYNRRYVLELAEAELLRVRRYGGRFSILLLDIDHFKQINDVYGHFAGDAVLRAASDLFRAQVRPSDTVGRYGGEEFLILLPETNCTEACEVAERFRQNLEETTLVYDQIRLRITTSIGVAFGSSRTKNLNSVLATADRVLYQAKHMGRNRVVAAEFTDF